jgi:hypothetical protein
MKTKFILLSLLALLVFSACNNEERKKAEAARIEAEIQAEAERIAALMLAETERLEAEAEAEAERIAAEEEAEAERIAAEKAKAREKAMLAKYEELMVNHYYEHDKYWLGDFVFALPNANGEGAGARKSYNGYEIFLYKIKDNGCFIIDFGKKSGKFLDWESVQENFDGNNDAIAEEYDVVIEGKYYVEKDLREYSKAEVYFYYDREMEYYDLSTSKTHSCYKKYDEDLYQEAMKYIKHCLPKAKEIMKR